MVLESQESKVRYQGNDLATEWPVPFPLLREEHLHLIVTDANGLDTLIDSNYEIKGIKEENVSVTYPVEGEPLASGHRLTIYREVPLVQQLDLENGGNFNAEVIERQFDNTVMQIQQIQEQIDRSIKVSISSEEIPKTAEDIYNQVNLIADRAEAAVSNAEMAVDNAREQVELATSAADAAYSSNCSAQAWAANPHGEPVQFDPETGEPLFSARHYRDEASEIAIGSIPDAAPDERGVVGPTENGEPGWVYQISEDGARYEFAPVEVPELPLASNTHPGIVQPGSGLKIDDSGVLTASSGIPLFGLIYRTISKPPVGFLDISLNLGLVPRSVYPQAIEELGLGEGGTAVAEVISEAEWQAEFNLYGWCGKFSSGDGATTFRFPLLRKSFIRNADPSIIEFKSGMSGNDAIRNITGRVTTSNGNTINGTVGAFTSTSASGAYIAQNGSTTSTNRGADFNASLVVPTADENRPKFVCYTPFLKVYDEITNTSDANMALMVQGYQTKLDAIAYENNNMYSATEIDTGQTWIDGKKIYRKIINSGIMPNSTTKMINPNIVNVKDFLFMEIVGITDAGSTDWIVGFGTRGTLTCTSSKQIQIVTTTNWSNYTRSYVTLLYTCTDR